MIDDEKAIISGIFDYFESKANNNPKYEPVHYYDSVEALQFLQENIDKIDLIIIDIAMEYGDGKYYEEYGGIILLKKISQMRLKIPVIILSVVGKDVVESQYGSSLEINVKHINRKTNNYAEILYGMVKETLEVKK